MVRKLGYSELLEGILAACHVSEHHSADMRSAQQTCSLQIWTQFFLICWSPPSFIKELLYKKLLERLKSGKKPHVAVDDKIRRLLDFICRKSSVDQIYRQKRSLETVVCIWGFKVRWTLFSHHLAFTYF